MLAAGMVLSASCQQGGFQTTPSGLKYRIIDDVAGTPAKIGDYLKIEIKTVIHDSVVMDTHKPDVGFRQLKLLKPNGERFDIMEGLAKLSKGDSAEFLIPTDSVMNATNRPPFVKKGDMIHIFVKVLNVEDEQQFITEMKQQQQQQAIKDSAVIQSYVDSLHLKGTRTPDGVFVIVDKAGSGPKPKEGQEVTIMYTGKTLDGKTFDSNVDTSFHHTQPLVFDLGQHMMIPGMEEGIMQLNKGSKATFILPSGLAYGPMGSPPVIKPNEVLMFTVELKDISDAPPTANPFQR